MNFDSSFRYKPSFETDIRSTFERIRRQQAQAREQSQPQDSRVKVLHLDQSEAELLLIANKIHNRFGV